MTRSPSCTLGRLLSSKVLSADNVPTFIRTGSAFVFVTATAICVFGLRFEMDQIAFRQATQEMQQIRSALETNEETLSLLKDAETGQRGYLLTGSVEKLEPYANSQMAVLNSLARLSRLLVTHQEAAKKAELLHVLVSEKLETIRRSIYLYDAVGPGAAQRLVRTERDRQLMDQIRLVSAAIKAEESAQLDRSSHFLEHTIYASHWFVAFGTLALVMLVFIAGFSARHEIGRQTRLTEQLLAANGDLRRANEDLEQFAYISSHDLQEPVRTVKLFTQLLNKKLAGRLDVDSQGHMQHILAAAQRISALISDVLQYAQVAARKPEPEFVDMERVFADVIGGCGALIRETNAEITHEPLPTLWAQPGQITIVLENLITNALKYRSQKCPKVQIRALERVNEWVFSVVDNGLGFDMRYSQQIFGLCKRLQSGVSGTGIGLAIARRIVENHRGNIWAISEPGQGSIFTFTIPHGGSAHFEVDSYRRRLPVHARVR